MIVGNKTNSENGNLVFLIFKKNIKTMELVIFCLFSKDIVKCLWNKDEISLTFFVFLFFLEYRENKISIFGICFIL